MSALFYEIVLREWINWEVSHAVAMGVLAMEANP